MKHCKNCDQVINENFCSNCGQPAALKKIDSHYISHEIQHLLHFEKGSFYTVKELIVRPGQSIRTFLTENRNKHIKPVAFLIFTSLIYTLIAHYFHIDDTKSLEQTPYAKSKGVMAILHWIESHYGYANILMGGFIALWIKIFFKKYGYNIFEITVLLCFVMGEGMLLLSIGTIFEGLTHSLIVKLLFSLISYIYVSWAIGQFFGDRKVKNYIKAFVAYLLGYMSFYLVAIIIGIVYDYAVN